MADESQHAHGADAEPARGFLQRELPTFRHLTGTMCGHTVLASVRTDPRLGPGVAASGPLAEAIQCLGNGAVRLLAGQSPDQVADRRVRAPAVLSRSVARDG